MMNCHKQTPKATSNEISWWSQRSLKVVELKCSKLPRGGPVVPGGVHEGANVSLAPPGDVDYENTWIEIWFFFQNKQTDR